MATGQNINTYFQGTWHKGNPAVINAADHGAWLGSNVFDGARYFNGVAPDLLAHCERVNNSAKALMMEPKGQRISSKFNSVTPCNDHTNWGYESVRQAQSDDGDDNGVSTIVWCSLTEGTTFEQVLAADKKFNEYADAQNIKGGAGRWWPGSGIPSRFDADFLWSQSADNLVEWGKAVDQAVNGGGNQMMQSIYGDLMTCNNRAVYNVTGVRSNN